MAWEDAPEQFEVCSSLCQCGDMVPSLEVFYVLQGVISIIIDAYVVHLELVEEWSNNDFWCEQRFDQDGQVWGST